MSNYLYHSNVDPRQRFTRFELLMDDSTIATLELGGQYTLTATEHQRAQVYIVLQSAGAGVRPHGVSRVPSLIIFSAASAVIGASPALRASFNGVYDFARLACVGAPSGSDLSVSVRVNEHVIATLVVDEGTTTEAILTDANVSVTPGDDVDVYTNSAGSDTPATSVILQLDGGE